MRVEGVEGVEEIGGEWRRCTNRISSEMIENIDV